MRWQLIILLAVILLPSVTAQIELIKEKPKPILPTVSYDKYSEDIDFKNGTHEVIVSLAQVNIFEDNVWKKIEDANSLRGSDYNCVVEKKFVDDPDVVCVDWNWTSVRLNITPSKIGLLPVKYFEKVVDELVEKVEREENLVVNKLSAVDEWYNFKLGDVIHVGENSTEVVYDTGASLNDVNCRYNYYYTSTNAYITMGSENGGVNHYDGGLRFPAVAVGAGDTVDSSYISFKSYGAYSGNTVYTRFYAQTTDNAPIFPSSDSSCSSFEARPLTSASALWSAIGSWSNNIRYDSVDISEPIQEVIDGGDWETGDPLVIIFMDEGSSSVAIRTASSYDDAGAGDAPTLHIFYTGAGGAGNSCSCPSVNEDWVVDLLDNCNITSDCNLGTGTLSFNNTGWVNCSAEVNSTGLGGLPSGGVFWMDSDAIINVI